MSPFIDDRAIMRIPRASIAGLNGIVDQKRQGEPIAKPYGPFKLPTSFIGRIAGWMMSRQNAAMNRAAVKQLKIEPSDRVLEIGFGPGQAIKLLATTSQAQMICGIDLSPVMLEQAAKSNRSSIEAGCVVLIRGTVSAMPFLDDHFTKVFAVSTFHDWESRSVGLNEAKRVLTNGGSLVLCVRREKKHPYPWSSPGLTSQELDADLALIKSLGYRNVRLFTRKLGRR